jgi:hypothetical protein
VGTVTVVRSPSGADSQRWSRSAAPLAREELLGEDFDRVALAAGRAYRFAPAIRSKLLNSH